MRIFSFTLILCLLTLISQGQERELKLKPKRTDKFIHMDGLRVGLDISRSMQHLWNKGNRYGTELSFDFELVPNLYPVLETGWEKLRMRQDYVDYSSSGSYTRLGFDYNLLVAEHPKDMDMVYVGLRYGFDFANQQVKEYLIPNYWGDITGSFGRQNYNSQWAEFVLGMKGEIFKNFFLGWGIRGKLKLNQKDFDIPHVYFNPGYGPAEKKFNFDFSYSVYYNLPFNFRK
ncbi:DUF6048 family protein [Sunxiuqinia elliptica]|uniref:Outer membrane protein with beta-barrel domain n=1 Tax=Sunxiuqinia elliptica TaxID=655355 RepID=A0A4R6H601_9BACT|nr:DUF6048 family protein [Sunxiuqinia elliptica]TDO03327.1 hypothetical protein DET52_103272 [Sunxiuqinia elliptica]TDO59524.1 hypothetical protein DET65_2814 [Sunxiuqinia elliptica]